MQTTTGDLPGRRVLHQPVFNTVLWVGDLPGQAADQAGGQVFTSPSNGRLHSLQLYADVIPYPGLLRLNFYRLDEELQDWGAPLAESSLAVQSDDLHTWISFALPPTELSLHQQYGFKVYSADAMVGLGEAIGTSRAPFTAGASWHSDADSRGYFYHYFSLAYQLVLQN